MPRLHIMHVPNAGREQYVKDILEQAPEAKVFEDPRRLGATHTWSRVMMSMAKNARESEWHVQLNDDVVLLPDWQEHLEKATANSPTSVLGLSWIGRTRGVRAYEQGKAYALGDYLAAGYGVAYHWTVVEDFARFAHAAALTGYKHDDSAMGMLCKHRGIKQSLVARSIFGNGKTKSLLGHAQYETALYTIEDEAKAEYAPASWIYENCMGQREDEEQVMDSIRKAGWAG